MPQAHNKFIEQHVKGLRFADVGGLWGTVNEKVSVATKAGAKSVTLVDITPQNHAMWTDVRNHCASLGVYGYSEVTGNLDDVELPSKIGTFEFVHCSGIIYHCPNPIHTLGRLYALTERFLLLGSMTVPQKVAGKAGALHFEKGFCMYLPGVSGREKSIISDHFSARNIKVHNIAEDLKSPWFMDGQPSYEPWWWLWTVDTLASMLCSANFRVLEVATAWEPDLAHAIFAEKV